MKVSLPKWVKGAALPAALTTMTPADASPKVSEVPQDLFSGQQLQLLTPHLGNFTQATLTLTSAPTVTVAELKMRPEAKRLEVSEEKRFNALATKEALGTITPEELDELESLDERRVVDQPPSNPRAIEARERLFYKIESLITELNNYKKHRRGKH